LCHWIRPVAGWLEVGKRADIAVWNRDLHSVSNEQIKDLNCVMTLLDGEVIFILRDSPIHPSQQKFVKLKSHSWSPSQEYKTYGGSWLAGSGV
jgi:hypothetical protein